MGPIHIVVLVCLLVWNSVKGYWERLGPSTVTQDEPVDEIMRPDKSDGPKSHCCSCLLVWNSVKDYWERLYGSVVYSITKLLIGMLLSIASPKSVRAQGRTFTFVVGGLCSVFILIMNEGFRPVEIFDWTLRWHGTVQYFHSVHTESWTVERLIFVVLRECNT